MSEDVYEQIVVIARNVPQPDPQCRFCGGAGSCTSAEGVGICDCVGDFAAVDLDLEAARNLALLVFENSRPVSEIIVGVGNGGVASFLVGTSGLNWPNVERRDAKVRFCEFLDERGLHWISTRLTDQMAYLTGTSLDKPRPRLEAEGG